MLPNDISRCVPMYYCPFRNSCERYLQPGRVAMDFSTELGPGAKSCDWRIEGSADDQGGRCAAFTSSD